MADATGNTPDASHYNAHVRVHSSAPTRLDLAGGTLDIWPLYLFHRHAQTLNAAITIRAECTISTSDDGAWHLHSQDTGATLSLDSLTEADGHTDHRLVLRLLQFFAPQAVNVETRSGSPVGAGLAGSSALNIALCGGLARYTGRRYTPDMIMTVAQNLEAQVIGVPTGSQDYRPAFYGGVASVELGPEGVRRTALGVDADALGARIVLVYTGQSRDSGVNNWEVTKRHIDGDHRIRGLFDAIAETAHAMRDALEAGEWEAVAQQLQREWSLRKQLAPGVTTPSIDSLIDHGLGAGAKAAKVCGAGGGGCVLFFCEPADVGSVRQTLTTAGATLLDAAIDLVGLEVTTD